MMYPSNFYKAMLREWIRTRCLSIMTMYLTTRSWKAQTTGEVGLLRAAVEHLLQHTQQPGLATFATTDPSPALSGPSGSGYRNVHRTSVAPDMSRENTPQPAENDPSGLVTAPMRSLYELTKLKNLRHNAGWKPKSSLIHDDFISQGVVSIEEAEFLFTRFMDINNKLLWDGGLLLHQNLDSVRRGSTMLAAAVLTIGALHTPGQTEAFHESYDIFVSLVCGSSLSRNHSLDDIRALCIGAFYLANLSWKLSGQATRIAAEIGLHQAFQKLVKGDDSQHVRVGLWYATYVCDHQFSIAHGRPPAAVDDDSTRNLERFMQGTSASHGDARLAAQVALFAILTEAYVAFGSDSDRPLEGNDIDQLRVYNVAIDQWRVKWQPRSKDCLTLGSYPSKALVLYYNFARFQLNSLALRGITPPGVGDTGPSRLVSLEHREAANTAIAAATSTLTLVLEDNDLRRSFLGVPIFTYTMVAFCATFLLKMAATWGKYGSQLEMEYTVGTNPLWPMVNTTQIVMLVQRSADMLAGIAENLNERHLAGHIATGMLEMLQQFHALSGDQTRTRTQNIPQRDDVNDLSFLQQGSNDNNAFWAGNYNFYDLGGTFGFALDETLLGQMAADNFELGL